VDRPFKPDTTSYDYDAPISEAGWITPKYFRVRVQAAHDFAWVFVDGALAGTLDRRSERYALSPPAGSRGGKSPPSRSTEKLAWSQEPDGLHVTLAARAPGTEAWALRVE
jgi:hypothetical protein